MQFTGEFTVGALGIIVSILLSAVGGIGTVITIFLKTRGDITSLQLGHAEVRTDMAEIKGDIKAMAASIQTNHIMLERVTARQEMMGAIQNLPNDIAAAMGKLYSKDR